MSIEALSARNVIYQQNIQPLEHKHEYSKSFKQELKLQLNKSQSAIRSDTGTDLALREAAVEYESLFTTLMLSKSFASDDREYEGGLGEEIFAKDLLYEIVKTSSDPNNMGQIAQSVYDEMQKQINNGELNIK